MLSLIIAGIISLILTSCIFSNGFISFEAAVAGFIIFDVFFIIFFIIVKIILEKSKTINNMFNSN